MTGRVWTAQARAWVGPGLDVSCLQADLLCQARCLSLTGKRGSRLGVCLVRSRSEGGWGARHPGASKAVKTKVLTGESDYEISARAGVDFHSGFTSDSPVSRRGGSRGAAGGNQPSPSDTVRPFMPKETRERGLLICHSELISLPQPRAQVLWTWWDPAWQPRLVATILGAPTTPAWLGQFLLRSPSLPGTSAECQSPDTHLWAMSVLHDPLLPVPGLDI